VRQLIRIGLDNIDGWIPAAEALTASVFTTSYQRVAAKDLPSDAVVLDVRGADEYAAKHVKGAKNIAYTRLAARFDEVPAASPLHVHCAGGLRAAIAAAYLASRGREVIHVDGPFAEIPESMIS
jgi:hydroxyacylglutathione hydrolase